MTEDTDESTHETVEPHDEQDADATDASSLTRRAALTGLGLAGLLGLGAGTASADPQGQVGTATNPLQALYTKELYAGDVGEIILGDVLDLDGNDLTNAGLVDGVDVTAHAARHSPDGSDALATDPPRAVGTTNAEGSADAVARADHVHDHGALPGGDHHATATSTEAGFISATDKQKLDGLPTDALRATGDTVTGTLSFDTGTAPAIAAAGDSDLTIAGSAGNGVTITTDDGTRVLSLGVPGTDFGNTTGGNVVAGHPNNSVNNDAVGVVIGGGGGSDGIENTVGGNYATVGGGHSNSASGRYTTVGGGTNNEATEPQTTVGGGSVNTASSLYSTVGGGGENTASGGSATVAGGYSNTASGGSATVAGGEENTADGEYSFAAGRLADTNGNDGAFVFGDSSSDTIQAQNADEIRSQMPMHAPSFNTTSARAEKTAVEPVDPESVLDGVRSLSVSTWKFDEDDDTRHIGPMAGDFQEAFGVGGDSESIATVDADGVALAAIQGLSEELDDAREELAAKEDTIAKQADRIDDLEAENARLRERNTKLEARLDRIETHLGIDAAGQQGVADD